MNIRLYFTIAMACTILCSCKNSDETELSRVRHERDSVIALTEEKDSSIADFIRSFSEIENNLGAVKVKQEGIILASIKKPGESADKKARILDDIETINNLMDDSRRRLISLNKKLNHSENQNAGLRTMTGILLDHLSAKNTELASLNNILFDQFRLNQAVSIAMVDFGIDASMKSDTIAAKNDKLNTAYFAIASGRNLEKWKLIDKNEKFIVPERELTSDYGSYKGYFRKMNIRDTIIPVMSEGAKLITSHPKESFRFECDNKNGKEITNLVVLNPASFWKASKYLVIETK